MIKAQIISILMTQSYDRGHSAGEAEVQAILDGLLGDFQVVFDMLDGETH